MKINFLQELKKRSLIFQSTDEKELMRLFHEKTRRFYCGFDPTAQSLHVGHLLMISISKRLQNAGFSPYIVIGGATGLIGDPSFKDKERDLKPFEEIQKSTESIKAQLSHFLDFKGDNKAIILNNFSWIKDLNVLEFLRDIGKHFSIQSMIKRDAIQKRIEQNENGISFTEFSYSLIQAYDYLHLKKEHNVDLQIGGSDQWGNIASGISLIRKKLQKNVHGMTIPLLLQKNGEKFGKTNNGTVWLNEKLTSPYSFHQFWLQTSDELVWDYIFKFILKPLSELNNLYKEIDIQKAQSYLADYMTELVHGTEKLKQVKKIQNAFFDNNLESLYNNDLEQLEQCGMPFMVIGDDIGYIDIIDTLTKTKLCSSNSDAKRQIKQKAIYLDGKLINEDNKLIEKKSIKNRYMILRKGKKTFALIKLN